jgi:hypothetical protein
MSFPPLSFARKFSLSHHILIFFDGWLAGCCWAALDDVNENQATLAHSLVSSPKKQPEVEEGEKGGVPSPHQAKSW